jgi:hypothetical protein
MEVGEPPAPVDDPRKVRDDMKEDGRSERRWRAGARSQLSSLESGLSLVRAAVEREPVAVEPSLRRLSTLADRAAWWLETNPGNQRGRSGSYQRLVLACQMVGAPSASARVSPSSADEIGEIEQLLALVQVLDTGLASDGRDAPRRPRPPQL